jgi:hypothetical protein
MQTARASLGSLRPTSAFVLIAVAGAVSVVMAACGGSSSTTCSAGDQKSCTCVDGMSGTAACGANDTFGPCVCSSEGGAGEGGTVPYMALCMVVGNPGDCAPPDQCFNYPNRGKYCTHACTMASDCAPPSSGCNGMGVCKAPGAGGPVDGGPMETGGPTDGGGGD